ncbi:OLC1v1022957C1 [Oldenlandia corymbosa var. corymbosa]|uniref:OLC1v1022957C1 n=1 Tax=Oldenlandia corymbosa var. corymbosa TaxID=529605 RepID=A0AAV1BYY1_OLDCO|nr:OLC1v1022957C1 [Oldenlandia corymbosa var. corymbosa]
MAIVMYMLLLFGGILLSPPPAAHALTLQLQTTFGCQSCLQQNVIVNAFRSSSQRVTEYVPDEETRWQIGLFTNKLAQNSANYALRESYKLVPGGKAVAEIVDQTMRDVKSENRSKNAMPKGGGDGGKITTSCGDFVAGGAAELGRHKAIQSPDRAHR